MPLYEYRCAACEHQFEVIQSFSDKPIRKCEKCGGKVEKLISRAGFVLKGGGWYKSDYALSKPSSKEGGSQAGSDPSPGTDEASDASAAAPPAAAAASPAKPSKKADKAG